MILSRLLGLADVLAVAADSEQPGARALRVRAEE
jgi:hypothetical protein